MSRRGCRPAKPRLDRSGQAGDNATELHKRIANTAHELLTLKRLRPTPKREAVLALLLAQGEPLSHAEVERLMPADTDRVTLYRALEALSRAGLAHQVLGADGVWRYCSHDPFQSACPGNHPHFQCQACGKMICLLDQVMPRVEVPREYRVTGKQLVALGLCDLCRKRRPVAP